MLFAIVETSHYHHWTHYQDNLGVVYANGISFLVALFSNPPRRLSKKACTEVHQKTIYALYEYIGDLFPLLYINMTVYIHTPH